MLAYLKHQVKNQSKIANSDNIKISKTSRSETSKNWGITKKIYK